MRTRSIAFFVVVIMLASIYPFIAAGTLAQGTNPEPDSVYLPIEIKPAPTATPVPTPTTSPSGDIDAPHLITWGLSPNVVNVSASAQIITFTAHLIDDLSGVVGMRSVHSQALFTSPSGKQGEIAGFRYPRNLISGTDRDGIYQSIITMPRFSETGEWKMKRFLLYDNVGNSRQLDYDDIIALGLPASIFVQN